MTMAKGSGGVGKKSGSVSGAKVAVKAVAKAASFGPGDITPANLETAAKGLAAADTFHGQAYLAPLLAKFGTTPQAAQKQLIALHQDGKITLKRADMVEAMDSRLVQASEIPFHNYRLHFIVFK